MTTTGALRPAFDALDSCEAALAELDARCCEPGRSPSMKALAETLTVARRGLDQDAGNQAIADAVIAQLEDAGAQVGRLQVGCCAPGRLPLYADLLEGLTTAQLTINSAAGRGH